MITIFSKDKETRDRILPYEVALDNIRSAHNVGSILRNGDAFGCSRFHMIGITPGPDNEKVAKTSKGTESHLDIHYWYDHEEFYDQNQGKSKPVYALETTDRSVPLSEIQIEFPCCLVLGHEITGVSNFFLSKARQIISIPMLGKKNSINVAVASGIFFYTVMEKYFGKNPEEIENYGFQAV